MIVIGASATCTCPPKCVVCICDQKASTLVCVANDLFQHHEVHKHTLKCGPIDAHQLSHVHKLRLKQQNNKNKVAVAKFPLVTE